MLTGEVDVSLRHSISDCLYIVGSVSSTNLKVAVAAVTRKLVVAPFRRQESKRLVGLCKSR